MLVFLAIGDEVAHLPQEWFLNTPVLWLGALVLIGLVRGPLRNAPVLLRKPLKFAAASLHSTWLGDLAYVGTGASSSKANLELSRTVDSAFGTDPYWLDSFVLLDFPGAT